MKLRALLQERQLFVQVAAMLSAQSLLDLPRSHFVSFSKSCLDCRMLIKCNKGIECSSGKNNSHFLGALSFGIKSHDLKTALLRGTFVLV